jgi:hypothetical protein
MVVTGTRELKAYMIPDSLTREQGSVGEVLHKALCPRKNPIHTLNLEKFSFV